MGANGLVNASRNVLLLASGEEHAETIAKSLTVSDITDSINVPASILQLYRARPKGYGDAFYMLDEGAAAGILGRESELRSDDIFTVFDGRE